MATQHPDNAAKPYWHGKAFISTSAEVKECYLCYSDLSINEYNWDWEGKFVDEAVVDRLLHRHYDYFQKHTLGQDKYLTFRIPNPRVEKQFRVARAFMVMITSSQYAQSLGFKTPPIFETILPLTETAEEIIEIQEAFRDLVSVEHRLLAMSDSVKEIEIIPLFEQVGKIIDSPNIIRRYLDLYQKSFKRKPDYLRPYCARSDPALNSGLVPTVCAVKLALSRYGELEEETGVKLYPMLGTGSLPFRGGLSPDTADSITDEYAGVRTFIIQSAFRYDFPKEKVKQAIDLLNRKVPHTKIRHIPSKYSEKIIAALPYFEGPYRKSIEHIAPLINKISDQVARRRERVQHIGLFGYSRGVGKVTLPRAIPFTASLYSIGIPPELIGTGRGIKAAREHGLWEDIVSCYPQLKKDLDAAGRYLNKDSINHLAKKDSFWYEMKEDIACIEQSFGIELGPLTHDEKEHARIANRIVSDIENRKEISGLITQAGLLRHSLG